MKTKVIVQEYDEMLDEYADRILRESQTSGLVQMGEYDAYNLRQAARVLRELRKRVKGLETTVQ